MHSDKVRIALISPEKSPYSTTFIKAHIDLLDAPIQHLYGIYFPVSSSDGKYSLKESDFLKKAFYKLKFRQTYKAFFRDPQLINFFKKEQIQLVLAEFGPVGAEVHSVCELLDIPLIVHFHGFDAYAHSTWAEYGHLYRSMFAYAKYIIVVSKDMEAQLISKGAPKQKLVLNPYGPNHAFFDIQPAFETINFIAVGRFVEKKAPNLTIAAFKQVQGKVPQVRLLMAGDGPLLASCQELVKELNIEDAVTFLGAASHQEVVKLYQKASCFVQHSVVAPNGDSEGTPLAILEAGAAGLPIVATKHAGIQDVIVHGETGFLVSEHDVGGMADYMIQLAQDKNLAKNMGQQGRNRIKENFTMDRHIAVIDDLIKRAVQ